VHIPRRGKDDPMILPEEYSDDRTNYEYTYLTQDVSEEIRLLRVLIKMVELMAFVCDGHQSNRKIESGWYCYLDIITWKIEAGCCCYLDITT
jgi:hypothetical protein